MLELLNRRRLPSCVAVSSDRECDSGDMQGETIKWATTPSHSYTLDALDGALCFADA